MDSWIPQNIIEDAKEEAKKRTRVAARKYAGKLRETQIDADTCGDTEGGRSLWTPDGGEGQGVH